MPADRLPDLESRWRDLTKKVYVGIEMEKPYMVEGALMGMNLMLEEKYRVEMSNEEYEKKRMTKHPMTCSECGKESILEFVKRKSVIVELGDRLLSGGKLCVDGWECPDCGKDVWLSRSDIGELKVPKFTILGVVPQPPQFKFEIPKKKFLWMHREWAINYLNELYAKFGIVRNEYMASQEREF